MTEAVYQTQHITVRLPPQVFARAGESTVRTSLHSSSGQGFALEIGNSLRYVTGRRFLRRPTCRCHLLEIKDTTLHHKDDYMIQELSGTDITPHSTGPG